LEIKLPFCLFRYGAVQVEQSKLLVLGGRNEEMNDISKKAFTIDLTNGEVAFVGDLPFPTYTTRKLYIYDDAITIFHDEEFVDIPMVATYYYTPLQNTYSHIY
jgi:hypothetical protein